MEDKDKQSETKKIEKPYMVTNQDRPVFINFGTIEDIKRRLKEQREQEAKDEH